MNLGNFVVRVDHLSDQELGFYGWQRIQSGPEFSLYLNVRYSEAQPVSNQPPRYLIVDDINDAQEMNMGGPLFRVTGPRKRSF